MSCTKNTLFLGFVLLILGSVTVSAEATATDTSDTIDIKSNKSSTEDLPISNASSLIGTQSTSSTTSSKESETSMGESTALKISTLDATTTENGTKSYPYIVSSLNEMRAALLRDIPIPSDTGYNPDTDSSLHIKVAADIYYTGESGGGFTVAKNIVIDGSNFSFIMNGTTYTGTPFSTGAKNISVTLKNIKYTGNSSYYGIMRVVNSGVILNIENITYNITNGAQPFFSGQNDAIMNLSGNNVFNLDVNSVGKNSEEFMQGFGTINVTKGSSTQITNNSTSATSIFYLDQGVGSVTVEENAELIINSSKPRLFYGNNSTLTVNKNALFIYENTSANTPEYNNSNRYTNTINAYDNSLVDISVLNQAINMRTVTLNATNPQSILVGKSEDATFTGNFMSGTLKFVNSGGIQYQLNNGIGTLNVPVSSTGNVVSGATNTTQLTYSGADQVSYEPSFSLTGTTASGETGKSISQINVTPVGFESEIGDGYTFKTEYFVSTKSYSNSRGVINQRTIKSDLKKYDKSTSSVKTIIKKDEVSNFTQSGSTYEDNYFSITNMSPGSYYVYSRLVANNDSIFITTPWYQSSATVDTFISLEIPESLKFIDLKGSIIYDDTESSITNYSNVPINVKPTKLTVNDGSDATISLVNQLNDGVDNQLALSIIATSGDITKSWQLLNTMSGDTLSLNEFWQNGSTANLTLAGNTSDPLDIVKKVSYNVSFDFYKGG